MSDFEPWWPDNEPDKSCKACSHAAEVHVCGVGACLFCKRVCKQFEARPVEPLKPRYPYGAVLSF